MRPLGGVGGGRFGGVFGRVFGAIRRSASGWCTQAGWCSRRQSTYPELDARSTAWCPRTAMPRAPLPPPLMTGCDSYLSGVGRWEGEGERGEWGGVPCRRVSTLYLYISGGEGGRRGDSGEGAERWPPRARPPRLRRKVAPNPEAVSGRGRARVLNRKRTFASSSHAWRHGAGAAAVLRIARRCVRRDGPTLTTTPSNSRD